MQLRFKGYSTFEEVNRITNAAIDSISKLPGLGDEKILFKINVAFRELLNNAVEHGNNLDPRKKIYLNLIYDGKTLELTVEDEGLGFCLQNVFGKVLKQSPERARLRGVALIKDLGFHLETNNSLIKARFYIEQERK